MCVSSITSVKSLCLSIILILTCCATGFLCSNAYAQSENTTIVRYVPLQGSELSFDAEQGQEIKIPVQVVLPPGYKIINLLSIVSPWPDGIYSTFSPQSIQNTSSGNTTLQIYVQPYVTPGNYTLDLVAQGWVNDTTGNEIMVNSEPPTPVSIKVLPRNGEISLTLGNMTDIKRMNYCYDNGCSGFTSIEKYQILLQSRINTTVSLSGPDVLPEKWIHFDPVQVNTGPESVESFMTIAGMVQSLTGINPISTKIFTVKAESQDGSTAQVYFPYENNFDVTVLHRIEPIKFTQPFETNINGNNSGVYAVVYDPGKNDSISVQLSVAGLEYNDQIIPLPSSIDMKIKKTSFLLNSSQIYYIPVIVRTSNAVVGNHYVVINETIGDKQFLSTLPFYVMPNICTGGPGMCQVQSTPEFPFAIPILLVSITLLIIFYRIRFVK